MHRHVSRRRIIGITAAAAGLQLIPLGRSPRASEPVTTWRGPLLGAEASMQIHHPDPDAAQRLIVRSLQEARRLERIFSLYLKNSALVRLNGRGVLEAPPPELVELLGECRRYSELTDGAFDPTVQPLWHLYYAHFTRPNAGPMGPTQAEIDSALRSVGLGNVLVSPDRIVFARRGMALTLNGIAQGYITDRVVALLRSHGIEHSLVDMGEVRAIGARSDRLPWQVAVAAPEQPAQATDRLPIVDQAVATSGGYGFEFDSDGRFTHLFNPKTGLSPHRYRSVTVVMPTAAAADALSTAFSLMPIEDIRQILSQVRAGEVHLVMNDGRSTIVHA